MEAEQNKIIKLSSDEVKHSATLQKYIELDKRKEEIKKYYQELDDTVKDIVSIFGVGFNFQDQDGVVYLVDTCEWKQVKMTPYMIKRTRREGERQGDLSMSAARELGYEVEGK